MKRSALVFLLLLLVSLLSAAPIPFAVVAGNQAVATSTLWEPIIEELRRSTGLDLQLEIVRSHDELVSGFYDRLFPVAVSEWYWANQLINDGIGYPITQIAIYGTTYIHSILIVRHDSVIRSLEGLDGTRTALIEPLIYYEGNTLPRMVVDERGIQPDYVVTDTAESVIKGVAYGALPAGFIPDYRLDDPSLEPWSDQLRIVYESPPIPSPLVIVHRDIDRNAASALQQALPAITVTGISFIVPDKDHEVPVSFPAE